MCFLIVFKKIICFLRKLKAIVLNKNFNNHIIQVVQGHLNNCHKAHLNNCLKTTRPKRFAGSLRFLRNVLGGFKFGYVLVGIIVFKVKQKLEESVLPNWYTVQLFWNYLHNSQEKNACWSSWCSKFKTITLQLYKRRCLPLIFSESLSTFLE